jgi:hypothetical protein
MFSLFKKSPPSIAYTDKVWKTEDAATKGMLMMAMMKLQQNQPCLILTFFESEKNRLMTFMNAHELKFILVDEPSGFDDASEAKIYLVEAASMSRSTVIDFLSRNQSRFGPQIYFPSHYPLSGPEHQVLEKLSAIGFSSFVFCLSFDDPLLKMFGSESILPLLEKLGLDDNEALEHRMITQSILRAREKVGKKVRQDVQAKSPQEWFALNRL